MLEVQLIVMGYNSVSVAGWGKLHPCVPRTVPTRKSLFLMGGSGQQRPTLGTHRKCPGLTCDSTPDCFAPSFKYNPKFPLFQASHSLPEPVHSCILGIYFLFKSKSLACLPLFTTSCSYILECLPVMTLTCSPITHLLG